MKQLLHLKLLAIVLMGVLCSLNVYGVTLCDTIKHNVRQYVSTLHKEESQTFISLNLSTGATLKGEIGHPSLPCRYLTFSVPYNSRNFRVKATVLSSSDMRISRKIMPMQKLKASTPIATDTTFVLPDSTIYCSNKFIPDTTAWIEGENYMAGDNHTVTVGVMIASYNPSQNIFRKFTKVAISLSFDESNGENDNHLCPISRNNTALSKAEREQVKSWVVNSNQVDAFAMNSSIEKSQALGYNNRFIGDSAIYQLLVDSISYGEEYAELATNNEFEYNIITSQALAPAFKKIIALKRQKGYYAGVVTVDRIMANSLFNCGDKMGEDNTTTTICDSAGCVREYLKYAFKRGTRYVLLGGKTPHCPIRYGWSASYNNGYIPVSDNQKQSFIDHKVPSDLYFSNLTTNWNNDNDEFYGEYGTTHFDFSPQLYTGRLLADKISDIENYTDKLLRYELLSNQSVDYSYLGKLLCVQCSRTTGVNNNSYSDELISKLRKTNAFDSYSLITQSAVDNPMGKDVINAINTNAYGILSFNGHGTPMTITVSNYYHGNSILAENNKYPYLDATTRFSQNDSDNGLDCLTNIDKPGILYSIACTTMPFDTYEQFVNPKFKFNTGLNLGESYTLGKNYGGVAFLGNTREGYFGSSNALEEYFYQLINTGNYNIGKSEALSKVPAFIDKTYIPQHIKLAHNLLGDPEVELWTTEPKSYSGITVSRTDNSITVSGINSESDATVAYCNNYMQGRATTATGSITFSDVSPNSSIMVYQHNYKPFIAPIIIQNEMLYRSQYVFASSFCAGNNVDSHRTQGNVIFKHGCIYEVEATDDVTLGAGVIIEDGASLKISTSGKVVMNGVSVQTGGTLLIQANTVEAPQNINANKGGKIIIEKFSPLR